MKILSFLALLLFLVLVTGAQEGRAQVAVDSVSGVTGPNSNVISRTWAHTVGAGSNRLLIVGVSMNNGAANVSSITYGGIALVSIGSRTDSGQNNKIEIWKLVAPASGTANIVVTLSAAKRIVAGSVSFTGVDQTTPNGTFASNVGTNGTPTVNVTSATGELVIDTFATQGDANPATAGATQTQRWNRTTGGSDGNEVLGGASTEPGAASVTMSWGLGQGQPWSIGAVSLKPVSAPTYNVSGTVFEDVTYGGGAGRSLASSSGSVRSNARVELYNGSGNFVTSTTTNASGVYTFSALAAGSYTVRVVNSTVTSSRSGYVSTLIPVQTFRTDAGSGSAVSDINRVGGEVPTKADAASNTTNATLASLTTATTAAQSIAPATVGSANITGVDFGFNFDTVVNINDAGQGSLRQFITNSNALGNGGLAQAGLNFGEENSIFMISDGFSHSGLRAGLTNLLTGGVANITPASLLPAITDASTSINGTTQTTYVGNTNSGSLGAGGQVGVDNLSLSTVARPEILLVDNSGVLIGLDVQANSVTIRGLAIYGFGTSANTDGHANIRIGNNFTGTLITENVLGSTATSFTDPGAGVRSMGDNIRSQGGDNGIVRNNLIGFSQGKGFGVESTSTGWLIENNEIRGNGISNSHLDGIDIENSSGGATVRGNLIRDNEGVGVDSYLGSGTSVVINNTITNNGFGPGANVETAGVRLFGVGNTVDRNIIAANAGAGVAVTSNSTGNTITRNSIYANGSGTGQIGIDLLRAADDITRGTAPFVTQNDAGDADAGGNDLFNFPVLTSAIIAGGNLTISGYARPGTTIELFIAESDPSGFGEGRTYKVTLTEGSAADTDATTGTYTNPVNGLNQGTDTTNKFSFTIATPSGVGAGTILTATGTLGGSTSEFSGNVTVTAAPPDLTIAKSHAGNFTQGQVGASYSITATNSGSAATSGTVTVTDTLPAGLTATAISGTGWTCVLGTLTCTRSDALAAVSSYPVITLTVTVANNAAASVTNSVTVSGGGQSNTANDSATDPTTINQLPDLTITKSHTGNFTQGQVGATYSLTATNSGFAATSGTVTVVDTLPAGLTATAISGTGWTCVLGTLTCTRSDGLAVSSSYPVITLTVTVANNAAASVTNSVSISGGGQSNTANDSATDPTTVNQLADLTITKSHTGNFTQGQVGATYSITATNSGFASTSGTVTVTDTLPVGLTATAISGTGWTCVLGTLTCIRSDALAAGSSYPVITLTVTVANNAAASVTNSASVAGGGETNTANDSVNDPTTINQLPDLTITKSHTGNFTQGQVGATYSITTTNSGFASTSGTVTATDTLPAGLTATAISGTGWTCVLGTLTCTRSDALVVGSSYPAITLTVNVSLTAPASVTNSASVSGGGQSNTANDTANDLTTINPAAPPSVGLVKSVSPGGSQIPGTDLLYTVVYTNTGGQPATNFIIVDPNTANLVPAERVFRNVDFKIGSLTSSPSSTGLVATFEYSNNGGSTWTYTPVSGGGGAPAGYDRAVTNVRWVFVGSLSHIGPNNTGNVSLTVRIR